MRTFDAFACIDWSGARGQFLPGIAVAMAGPEGPPALLAPPGGAKAWSRACVRNWLADISASRSSMLIGIDLSPAFPFLDTGAYFPGWDNSPQDARSLWALVEQMSADDHMGADGFLSHSQARRHFRHSAADVGDLFGAGIGRLRRVEVHQRATRQANSWSCFNLVGAGQVGKSSITGMRLLHALKGRLPIWPFDSVPDDGPLLVEIYTSMAARAAAIPPSRSKVRDFGALQAALYALGSPPVPGTGPINDHASDALMTAAWLRAVHGREQLWRPPLLTADVAQTEGWTFGVI